MNTILGSFFNTSDGAAGAIQGLNQFIVLDNSLRYLSDFTVSENNIGNTYKSERNVIEFT